MDVLERARVRDSVKACTNCALYRVGSGPIPFSGPSDADIVVIGEAPGKDEDANGQPFVGVSGQLMRGTLADVGFDVDRVAFLNVVSCFPNRTPVAREVEACRHNVANQLVHIKPRWGLVVGGVSLSHWWTDIRIGDARGYWWRDVDEHTWFMATWHPAAVLRNSTLRAEWVQDLRRFKRTVATGGRDPLAYDRGVIGLPFNASCVVCKEFGDRWLNADNSESLTGFGAMPFCNKHWARRMEGAGKGRTK